MRTNVNIKPLEHDLHYIHLFCRLQVFSLTFFVLTLLDCSTSCILTFLQVNLRSLLSNLSWWSCKGLLLICSFFPPVLCLCLSSVCGPQGQKCWWAANLQGCWEQRKRRGTPPENVARGRQVNVECHLALRGATLSILSCPSSPSLLTSCPSFSH